MEVLCTASNSLVPRLPFQLSVACSTGKTESDGKLEGKPGNEAKLQMSILQLGAIGVNSDILNSRMSLWKGTLLLTK